MKIYFALLFVLGLFTSSCSSSTSSRSHGATEKYLDALNLGLVEIGYSQEVADAMTEWVGDHENVRPYMPGATAIYSLPDASKAWLDKNSKTITKLYVAGGTASVDDATVVSSVAAVQHLGLKAEDVMADALLRMKTNIPAPTDAPSILTLRTEEVVIDAAKIMKNFSKKVPLEIPDLIKEIAIASKLYENSSSLAELKTAVKKYVDETGEALTPAEIDQQFQDAIDALDEVDLIYPTLAFGEADANDGSMGNSIIITLTNDTFTKSSGVYTPSTHYALSGTALPAGLTAVVTAMSSTTARLSITGNATDHDASDNVSGITLTWKDAAFTKGKKPSNGSETKNFSITFDDSVHLAYSGTSLTEAAANNGSFTNTIIVTLTGNTFTQSSGTFTANTHYTLSGTAVPAGLTAVVTVNSTTQATLSFTGNAASHAAANNVSGITLTFNDAAFTGGNGPVDDSEAEDFALNFYDTATIVYSASTFSEAVANNGSITDTVTMTLSGNTFSQSSGTFTANTHYTLSGTAVPAGLTAVVTVSSATVAVLSFTGNAASHLEANDVSGITLTFNSAAFTNGIRPVDGTEDNNFAIEFLEVAHLNYSGASYSEAGSNNGSITTGIVIDLTGDTFTVSSGLFTENTHYTLTGTAIPAGLTAELQFQTSTQARLVLTGNAVAHAPGDSVTGIVLTWLDAAFTKGDAPADGTAVKNIAIDFIDPSIMLFEAGAPNGNLGGRSGADALCEAAQPVESSHANVRALISVDGSDEIRDMPANYSIPTNIALRSKIATVVADDWADLLDGDIDHHLINAGVVAVASFWWTGSDSSGALSSNHCNNWTSTAGSGGSGFTGDASSMWMSAMDSSCSDTMQALICVAFD